MSAADDSTVVDALRGLGGEEAKTAEPSDDKNFASSLAATVDGTGGNDDDNEGDDDEDEERVHGGMEGDDDDGSGGDEDDDDEDQDERSDPIDEDGLPLTPSPRKRWKRIVGSAATSIKQMKDAVVRIQAAAAVAKVLRLQAMTIYKTEKQDANNPKSHTILLNFDEIVTQPDKCGDGEFEREVPKITLLIPRNLTVESLGVEFEQLGKAMQEDAATARNKKTTGKKKKPATRDFDYECVSEGENYMVSIYGNCRRRKAKKGAKKGAKKN